MLSNKQKDAALFFKGYYHKIQSHLFWQYVAYLDNISQYFTVVN